MFDQHCKDLKEMDFMDRISFHEDVVLVNLKYQMNPHYVMDAKIEIGKLPRVAFMKTDQ